MATKKSFKTNPAELFISDAEDQQAGFSVPKGFRLVREYKSARLQLLLRPAVKEAIKKMADAQGLSMNDLIGQILDEYIERMENR